jgi:hypothetical protein
VVTRNFVIAEFATDRYKTDIYKSKDMCSFRNEEEMNSQSALPLFSLKSFKFLLVAKTLKLRQIIQSFYLLFCMVVTHVVNNLCHLTVLHE